jgi:hypothetical protein
MGLMGHKNENHKSSPLNAQATKGDKMSTKRVLVTILAILAMVLLVLSAAELAQATRPYDAELITLSGGWYILTGLNPGSFQDSTWWVSGEASGGSYRLSAPPSPASAGSGCCCTFLPCIKNNTLP